MGKRLNYGNARRSDRAYHGTDEQRRTAYAIARAVEREGGIVEYVIQRKAILRGLRKPRSEGGIDLALTNRLSTSATSPSQ